MLARKADAAFPGKGRAVSDDFQKAAHEQIAASDESGAVREGFAATKFGADEYYYADSPRLVEAKSKEGIPVSGHVGCVPRQNTWTGARSVGKTPDEAVETHRFFKRLKIAGAASLKWNSPRLR
ncbi:MAG: hypothetical protein OXN84_09020 [Albidovulum sp.]|nr:hypothetical protein [Albidovulum sp.]